MLVVVDTSVFVAALLGPGGASRAVLRACLEHRLTPLMGSTLFLEYEVLLTREALFRGCKLDPAQRGEFLDAFLSVCRWTTIYFSWRPNLRDEGDNHVVELAVAGAAAAIVTKNVRDFEGSQLSFPNLRVLRPQDLLKEMASWEL
jgi:uncharacterized protein